jgi:uncharacterized RDD family membrane protein YckC
MNDSQPVQYVGFWARFAASIIDTILVMIIVAPLVTWVYGADYWVDPERGFIAGPADFLLNWLLPAIAVILFWVYRQATPGKMAVGAKIVDAKTLGPPSTGQLIGRYFGYYVSIIPLCLGLIWVGIDSKKQGFHDKLAGTVVVRSR